ILAEESGVAHTPDPLGGSYFVEALTTRMETEAMDYIRRIDEMGGIIAAIEGNFPQREIAEAAFHYQNQIDRKEKTVVGVNKYQRDEEEKLDLLSIGSEVETTQLDRLKKRKAARNQESVRTALADLRTAAASSRNTIPPLLAAVRQEATVGEVSDLLKEVYGIYQETSVL
ncbi:MAG: methylmalonyl-CoA mutase family protein, partial [Acidobacteriota bacterium]